MSINDDPASFARTRELATQRLRRCFEAVEAELRDREWLFGTWSALDGYLLWLWFRAVGAGFDGSRFPRCAELAQRCELRPSVARALDREEAEYERLLSANALPATLPPYQAGRVPR
jgi:glutathione S-transferase